MVDFEIYQDRLWADVLAKLGGVDAIFTPMTGEPSSFKVLLTESMQLQPSGMAQTWVQVTHIGYSLADLPREAIVGETFTIDGTDYRVNAVTENDGYVVKVVVNEH
jgi:hypothetical protein